MSTKVIGDQKGKHGSEEDYLTYTHKWCRMCDTTKPVEDFYRKKTKTKRGWAWDTYCIECRRQGCRAWGANNKDYRNARLRRYRKNNPEKMSVIDRRRSLKQKYGMTPAQREVLLARYEGMCWVCRVRPATAIEHDHKTNVVRGMACRSCNSVVLAKVDADPKFIELLIEYVASDVAATMLQGSENA